MGGPTGKSNIRVYMVFGEDKVPKGFRRVVKGVNKSKSTLREKLMFFLSKKNLVGFKRSCCKMGRETNDMFQCTMRKFTFLIILDIHGEMS